MCPIATNCRTVIGLVGERYTTFGPTFDKHEAVPEGDAFSSLAHRLIHVGKLAGDIERGCLATASAVRNRRQSGQDGRYATRCVRSFGTLRVHVFAGLAHC